MTRVIRSRRAGLSRDEERQQPLYARMLGLKNLTPSGFLRFVFLEGAIALGILLALAELVSWWGVLVLPITVAMMVKLNDVVAGILARPVLPAAPAIPQARPIQDEFSLRRAGTVDLRGSLSIPSLTDIDAGALNGPPASRQWADRLDARQQWARQAATRRYE